MVETTGCLHLGLDTKGLTLSPVVTARAETKRRSVGCQVGSAPAGLAQGPRLAKSPTRLDLKEAFDTRAARS